MATEKRLIEANALLEKVQFRMDIDNKNAEIIAGCVNITRRLIENEPTVEAVEVVRCKECKFCERDHTLDGGGDEYYYCCHVVMEHGQTRPNEFCSYGERKDNA